MQFKFIRKSQSMPIMKKKTTFPDLEDIIRTIDLLLEHVEVALEEAEFGVKKVEMTISTPEEDPSFPLDDLFPPEFLDELDELYAASLATSSSDHCSEETIKPTKRN